MASEGERTARRRLLTPVRVLLVSGVAATAVGAARSARQARDGWAAYGAAPDAVEGPLPAGAATGTVPSMGVSDPRQIPLRGWWRLLKRAWTAQGEHHTGLLAAGVTYYAFLSIFPALIAVVLVYGLVSSPAQVAAQVRELSTALPRDARSLLETALQNLTTTSASALSFGLVVAVLTALFSASAAVAGLMGALNVVYVEHDDRNLVRKRGTALLLTLGAILFVVLATFLLTVLPPLVAALPLGGVGQFLLLAVRWVGLAVAFLVALAVLYRYGPDRANPKVRWVGPGVLTALVLWIVVSVGFSVYANGFSSYDKTYGTLAGVVVLLLWLYFTSYSVLLGAEVSAQAELSTAVDTTTGPAQPPGERGAFVADHVVGGDGRPQ